jgi:hypothetical protein
MAVIGARGFIGRVLIGRITGAIPVIRGDPIPPADVVVYLAKTSPQETVDAFEAARRKGARRFVFVSSIKVNGEESVRPFRSDDRPAAEDAYAPTS